MTKAQMQTRIDELEAQVADKPFIRKSDLKSWNLWVLLDYILQLEKQVHAQRMEEKKAA